MSNTQSTRRRVLLAVGSAALAAVTGCVRGAEPSSREVSVDEAAWRDVEEIRFEGRIQAWTGSHPEPIEGESNPPIVLFEGEEYDFRWVNKDGAIHNLEIRDDDGNVFGEYATDSADGEEEERALENVVPSPNMATYVCRYHEASQAGDIVVRRS